MSYDSSTGVYRSLLPSVDLVDNQDLHTFMFQHRSSSRSNPTDRTWLIDGITRERLTYSDCLSKTEEIAKVLKYEFEIGNDDVVGIFSDNNVNFPLVCWGAYRLGGIITPANPSYTHEELSYQLSHVQSQFPLKCVFVARKSVPTALQAIDLGELKGFSKSSLVVLDGPERDGIRSLNSLIAKWKSSQRVPETPSLGPGGGKKKLALLSFSSGTTGKPKAVMIPHASVISNILQMSAFRGSDLYPSEDKALGVLPFYHIYGLVVILHWMTFLGVPLVVIPKFHLKDCLQLIHEERITVLFLVPPIVLLLAKHKLVENYDLSFVRFIMSAAAPLSGEVGKAFVKRFPKAQIGQALGLTETATVITLFPPPPIEVASAGMLLPNIEAKIVDPTTGKPQPPKSRGELWSKSPSNAIGYMANPKATKETFDSEGYVHTGDEAYFDERGNLFVVDRIKELIKSRGFQVAPAELEGHILQLPFIVDAAVVGVEDDFAGEVPRAYVVLGNEMAQKVGTDRNEEEKVRQMVKKHVSDHKVKYKWLEGGVVFVDAIPKNPSGKLLRRQLRDRARMEVKATSTLQARL